MLIQKIRILFEKMIHSQEEMARFDHDKREIASELEDQIRPIIEYVGVVAYQTAMAPIWGVLSDDLKDYQQRIMAADQQRRIIHESAVIGVKALNRLMKRNGLDPFFPLSEDAERDMAIARREIRLCCAQVVCELLSLAWPDILSFDGMVLYLADRRISLDHDRSKELARKVIEA